MPRMIALLLAYAWGTLVAMFGSVFMTLGHSSLAYFFMSMATIFTILVVGFATTGGKPWVR